LSRTYQRILLMATIASLLVGKAYAQPTGLNSSTLAPSSQQVVIYIGSDIMIINGAPSLLDRLDRAVVPYSVHNTTYVPLRFIADQFGASVSWNDQLQTSAVTLGQHILKFIPDQWTISVDNKNVKLTDPVAVNNNMLFVPLREFSDLLGLQVSYDHSFIVIGNNSSLLTITDLKSKYEAVFQAGLQIHPVVKSAKRSVIYLTFDDGPSIYTTQFLDLLKAHHDHATFFMLYGRIQSFPNVVKRVLADGNSIGVHGVTHVASLTYRSPQTAVDEMNQDNDMLAKVTGTRTHLMRVPYGSKPWMPQAFRDATAAAGYRLWDWNVDSYDSRVGSTSSSITMNTIRQLQQKRAGSVIIFHDIKKQTLEALPAILNYMDQNNYTSVAITDQTKPVNFWDDER